jgi:hypothetical protein
MTPFGFSDDAADARGQLLILHSDQRNVIPKMLEPLLKGR